MELFLLIGIYILLNDFLKNNKAFNPLNLLL